MVWHGMGWRPGEAEGTPEDKNLLITYTCRSRQAWLSKTASEPKKLQLTVVWYRFRLQLVLLEAGCLRPAAASVPIWRVAGHWHCTPETPEPQAEACEDHDRSLK